MPPPPVPSAAPSAPPTSTKEKRRSKPLFGLAVPPWSRPTSPKNEDIPALSPPPHSPPSRPSKVSKIESWFKIGALDLVLTRYFRFLNRLRAIFVAGPSSAASSRPVIAAPQPCRPMALPPIPADGPEGSMRPHSTPPRVHASREPESSDSERDGRCSPLMGLFTGGRGRAKQRGRTHDYHGPNSGRPVVGAPVTRTRTASREGPNAPKGTGGAQLQSFEFEHSGGGDVRRSTSRNAHRHVASPHTNGSGHTQSHTYHSRGHARKHSHGQDARSHTRTHTRSRSHAHPARSHTHPQPSIHSGTGSPHLAPQSPLMHSATPASAASQSTAGTAATNTTGAAATGGTGSWGRVARTVGWVRGAGVHPPFAFESATSSTSANGERRWGEGGGGGSGSDIRERERDRDRERSRKHVAQARAPASPVRSVPSGPGRWEQREVELGLGLTWAPTKIRVREWTPGGVNDPRARVGGVAAAAGDSTGGNDGDAQARALRREREMEQRVRERDGERRTRERLAEYELGYARSRSRSRKDREVTGRFREVLGTDGFETFKKCAYAHSFTPACFPDCSCWQTCAGTTQI